MFAIVRINCREPEIVRQGSEIDVYKKKVDCKKN